MIRDLAAMKVPALLISGGEPFVRRTFWSWRSGDVLGRARDVLTTERSSTRNGRSGSRRSAWLTSASASTAAKSATIIPRQERAFRDAVRGIRHCRDAGIRVGVRFTVTKENVGEIDSIFNIVEEEGIGRLCLYHLVYSGRGAYLAGIDLEVHEKRALMLKLMDRVEGWNREERPIEVMTVDNHADAPFLYLRLCDRDEDRAERALALMKSNGGNRTGIAIAARQLGLWIRSVLVAPHLGSIPSGRLEIGARPSQLLHGLRSERTAAGAARRCKCFRCVRQLRASAEAAPRLLESDPAAICAIRDRV